MNPVLESLFKHRSIRKYKNQPLEEEKLNLIIKAAQSGPNWCNGQHVSIIAVENEERKKRMMELCYNQPFIAECSVFLAFCADFYRTGISFEKEGKDVKKYVKQLDSLIIGSHEVGFAIQNAIVAAESMGLGTVPIGGLRLNTLEIVKELNLPKYVIPICGLCIGYADQEPGIKPRLPPSAIFFKEKYDTTHLKEIVDKYDEDYNNYLNSRSSNGRDSNWSKSVTDTYTALYGLYNQDYELLEQQGYCSVDIKKNQE